MTHTPWQLQLTLIICFQNVILGRNQSNPWNRVNYVKSSAAHATILTEKQLSTDKTPADYTRHGTHSEISTDKLLADYTRHGTHSNRDKHADVISWLHTPLYLLKHK